MSLLNKAIKAILKRLPLGNYILFESRPDYGDNSKSVYDEMLARGMNKKYKIVWICDDSPVKQKDSIAVFVGRNTKLATFYGIRAKVLVCSNRFLEPVSDKQFSFFLAHGTAVKKVNGFYHLPESIRYCLAASPNTVSLRAEEFCVPEERVVPLGFPRNDLLSLPKKNLQSYFHKRYKKIVLWLPTYRQEISGGKTGSQITIPLLWDDKNAELIDDYCKKNSILIVIKPHFAQDMSFIKGTKYYNITYIDDQFFADNGISLYSVLGSFDALLTDYSSVYFDYTLCDKPIGLIWEDYEEYKHNPGFAVDMDYYMKGGVKIYSTKELLSFFAEIINGVDSHINERREIRDFVNISCDGMNSKRVVDFIIQKANL